MAATKRGSGMAGLFRQAAQEAKVEAERTGTEDPQVDDYLASMMPVPTGQAQPKKPKIFSVIDYIESKWGLDRKLYPVQRFIVKLYYHIPLDDKEKTIEIWDMFRENLVGRFTEVEYLRHLYDEGRCNIREQDHERRELVLAIGRRGGKTMLSSIFASYEVYRLLNMYNPQEYYGLPDGNTIQIVSVATDKEQAAILFREVSNHMARCEYFHPYKLSDNKTFVDLQTPFDLDTFGTYNRHADGKFVSYNGKSSIRVTFRPCIAKGLRGMGNIVIILDEMAHFIDEGGSSAEEIYKAVQPSAATFSPKGPDGMVLKHPDGTDYPVESRIICISSPLNKQGQFFDLFNLAMSRGEGSENMLALQMPTWEINPSVPISYYRQRFHADPNSFMVEHGARFSDRMRGWIERPEDLLACIDPEHRPRLQGIPRAPHQGGLDVAAVGDGTAFVLSHVEDDVIVIDYHEVWYAGTDWRESNPHLTEFTTPYARTLRDVERLDFDEIANWMEVMCRRFYITDVIFDRWEGLSLEQNLHKRGLKQFRSERFQKMDTSQMFQATKLLMYDRKLRLYDWPPPAGVGDNLKHSPLITELMTLQAEQVSKNIVEVEAPKGKHDDMSDALVRSVWLSVERLGQGRALYGATATPTISRAAGTGAYQLSRARMHGGFSERAVPKSLGLRFRR
jgi:hypothetical protein